MTRIKQLSIWAKKYKWASRFFIIFSFIVLNFLGIITGFLFNGLNVIFSSMILFLAILVCLIAWWKYPMKRNAMMANEKKNFYVLQKTCDFFLIGSTFIMFVYFGNRQVSPFNSSLLTASVVNSSSLPGDSSKNYKSIDEFKKMMKDENGKTLKWKERKKLMKTQIKQIKKDNSISEGGKVALIILTVLVAAGLAILIAALSCSLSCSGSEAAAVLVAILGYAGLIFLTIVVIRSIVRKTKKDKENEFKPNTN